MTLHTIKIAVITATTIFATPFISPQHSVSLKTVNKSNVAKALFSSGTAMACAWYYYQKIVQPYIIRLAQQRGIAYAIEFNKNFIHHYPNQALLFAAPLFFAAGQALIARDYIKKIWE